MGNSSSKTKSEGHQATQKEAQIVERALGLATQNKKKYDDRMDEISTLFEGIDEKICAQFQDMTRKLDNMELTLIQKSKLREAPSRKSFSNLESQCSIFKGFQKALMHHKESAKGLNRNIYHVKQLVDTLLNVQVGSGRFLELRLFLPNEIIIGPKHQEKIDSLIEKWVPTSLNIFPRDLKTLVNPKTFGNPHPKLSNFNFPWGIAVHPETGDIYTSEEDSNRVLWFNRDMVLLGYIYHDAVNRLAIHGFNQTENSKQSEVKAVRIKLTGPRGIAVSQNHRIAVVEYGGHSVAIFSDKLEFLFRFGSRGDSQGKFSSPYHPVFDQDENLYIADSGNRLIRKFAKDGTFVCSFGFVSNEIPKMPAPVNGVLVDESGFVYATWSGCSCIRVFHPDTRHSHDIPISPIGSGGWANLAHGPFGSLIVTDYNHKSISFYERDGTVLHKIELEGPLGAVFGLDGRFYATSVTSHKVFVY